MAAARDNTAVSLFLKYWLPVVIYGVFIFTLSSLPGKDIPELFFGQAVIFHLIEYAGFAWLISRAMKKYYPQNSRWQRVFLVLIFAVIYAISDEARQLFVPGRCASGWDIVVDAAGGLFGSIIYQ